MSETKELDPRRAARLAKLYIAFQQDPANAQFDDSFFCTEQSISIDQLKILKTSEVLRKIATSPFTNKHARISVDNVIRQVNSILASKDIQPKSLEGLINAFTNLLKHQQLLQGKPTERIAIEDLKKKPPEEIHRWLMANLSGRLARN